VQISGAGRSGAEIFALAGLRITHNNTMTISHHLPEMVRLADLRSTGASGASGNKRRWLTSRPPLSVMRYVVAVCGNAACENIAFQRGH
jgi:hypothetical protein